MWLFQLPLIWALSQIIPAPVAYTTAYIISGQVNFAIDGMFVWVDRRPFKQQLRHPDWRHLAGSWPKFMATNPVAGIINSAIQVWCSSLENRILIVIVANVVSGIANFGLKHLIVYRNFGFLDRFTSWLTHRRGNGNIQ